MNYILDTLQYITIKKKDFVKLISISINSQNEFLKLFTNLDKCRHDAFKREVFTEIGISLYNSAPITIWWNPIYWGGKITARHWSKIWV